MTVCRTCSPKTVNLFACVLLRVPRTAVHPHPSVSTTGPLCPFWDMSHPASRDHGPMGKARP